ncbi:MAG: DNA-processing protein DprA [Nannocystaceae bacterium]
MQQNSLTLEPPPPLTRAISPLAEMGAYEALWTEDGSTQKRVADRFRANPGVLPSGLVDAEIAHRFAEEVLRLHMERGVQRFGIRVHRAGDYPMRLRDARHPVELLQYRGIWELSETRCVAVVGTRKPTAEGHRRTRKLVTLLVEHGFTVVSGLAAGVDTTAHETAISLGASTVAVIGTPLSTAYPPENADLQEEIATNHLLISEVPVCRYYQHDWRTNRGWFPLRNATMSALTEATIIVEAAETSGTLTQARAALYQGRKLFILNNCFERPDLTWPARFEGQGAIRVRKLDDILPDT